MNLNDEFEVPLGVAEAWAVLTDIEKITPYLPGIWLREVEDEKYQGVVKVKVGPVTMWYEGVARYLLLDADAHRAVLKAEGGEIHGQGNGSALVTASLSPSARGTRVQVVTVLSIDGRLAQFADDVLAAVSRNLIAEFAENMEFTVLAAPKAAYRSTTKSEGDRESLLRRLRPYLTVAAIVFIAQITVYSLRLWRRAMVDVLRPFETPAGRVGSEMSLALGARLSVSG
ncbi:MAG: SRPBCC family protein [Acidimicrobiales bacterium]